MTAPLLHVFAVNGESDLRHTHLTRAMGEAPDLPPLADWLGLGALDTDEVEFFPLKDLGDMHLSDYLTMAFVPETAIAQDVRARLDALEGSVLLVPEAAMDGAPRPGPNLSAIATLRLAQPDHVADLPPAGIAPRPAETAPPEAASSRQRGPMSMVAIIALVVGIVLVLYVLVGL
ncbi:hypothetical protein N8I71_00810 [Roseibacterium sp. SDUM158016]|uniref:hypothetical protein n=1 Tax=Roseicyclus sediminis TaxID=2980997 RepID=UPI0021D0A6BE|nr:hypothetical protein [Roseibacterium sp. SDUM158016]MCU4651356.1 hypothetical protein [Roseibacterium sp. SDUM158016]